MTLSVSVIMPVRNEEDSVENAIASVMGQTLPPLELLVVDGASTDSTVARVRAMAQIDPRIRCVTNEKRIIPAAMNVGLRESRGDVLARVDGHATISRTYLMAAVDSLEGNNKLAGVGGQRIGVANSKTGQAIACALGSPFGVGNSINHYATEASLTDHCSFGVYRRHVAVSVGGWDENLLVNEDVDFDYRIAQGGWLLGYQPEMKIHWHVRTSFASFFRQYRRYGRGKAGMVLKNGLDAVRLRHLAPPLLVAGLVLSLAFPARRPGVLARSVAPGLYLLSVLFGGVSASSSRGSVDSLRVGWAMVCMHVGWGFGFWEGLLLRLKPQHSSKQSASSKRGGQ